MLSLFRVAKVLLFFDLCKSFLYNFQTIFILSSAHSSYWLFIFNSCVISLAIVDLLSKNKQHFFTYSCIYTFFFVILHRKSEQSVLQTYYKSVYQRLFWHLEILQNFTSPKQEGSKRPLGYVYPAAERPLGLLCLVAFHIRRGRYLLILVCRVLQEPLSGE